VRRLHEVADRTPASRHDRAGVSIARVGLEVPLEPVVPEVLLLIMAIVVVIAGGRAHLLTTASPSRRSGVIGGCDSFVPPMLVVLAHPFM